MCKHVLCHALQFHHNRFYILPIYIVTETVHQLLARGRFPGKSLFFVVVGGGWFIKTELGSFDTFCKTDISSITTLNSALHLYFMCILLM